MKSKFKKILAFIFLGIGLIGLGGLLTWLFLVPRPVIVQEQVALPAAVVPAQPEVILVPRLIDGVKVPAGQENPFIYGVMMDNSKEGRPPVGLADASVVYEAMAEGGITRFLALFPATISLDKIGPVRSVRPYFTEWAGEIGASLAHAGGSPEALSKLKSKTGVYNLDEISSWGGPYFFRDRQRLTPHNLFTTSTLLARAARDLSWAQAGNYQPWQFKDPAPEAERGLPAQSLRLKFYDSGFAVEWRYDPVTNRYQRFQANAAHVDDRGQSIFADVIAVQFLPVHVLDNEGRLSMKTVGQGVAKIFQDGKVQNSLWSKASGGRTIFTDEDGQEMQFNRGKIWIEVRPKELGMTY